MIAKCLRAGLFLFIAVLFTTGSSFGVFAQNAGSEGGIRVTIPDTSVVVVDAGGVASRMFRVENTSSETLTSRLVIELPSGWAVLIPPPRRALDPGQAVLQLVSFQVPASTLAKTFSFDVFAEGFSSEKTTARVRVSARHQVEATWTQTEEFVRAGGALEGRLSVTNKGNSNVALEVRARSSLGYEVAIKPRTFSLEPNESKELEISARTQDNISGKLSHSLVAEVHVAGESEITGDASVKTATYVATILPVKKTFDPSREGMIPAYLTLFAGTKDGKNAGQVTLEVPDVTIGKLRYEALVRAPDASSSSEFADTDQYSFRVRSTRLDIRAGDHSYRLTDLLESGSMGMGGQVEYTAPKWTVGGYGRNSRNVFPDQKLGAAYFHFRPLKVLELELNAMHKETFETGDAFSLAAELTPGLTAIRTEVATGQFETSSGPQWGRAIDFTGRTSYKNSSLSLGYEEADANFLGAVQHGRAGSGSFAVALRPWLRWNGNANAQQRFYELVDGKNASQTNATGKTGLTITQSGVSRRYMSLSYIKQSNNNTLSARKRNDESIELKVGYNQRVLGVSGTFISGQTKDEFRPNLDRYLSTVATLYTTRGSFSLNVFGSYLNGPTFYNPVDQERIMLGGSVGWDSGVGTQAHINVFKSIDFEFEQQEFLLGDTRIVHRFPFGHDVTLRARIVQTAQDKSIQIGTVGLTYRIAMFLPPPGSNKKNANVVGEVVDVETGKPLSDIVLTLDGKTVITDENGAFQFRGPSGSMGYLSIDRLSAGIENRPIQEFPMSIPPDQLERQPIRIEMVKAAKLQIQLGLDDSSVDRNTALSDKVGPEDMASIVVEARNGTSRIRRLGGRESLASFTDLIPGEWKIFAVGNSIPEGYRSVPDTLTLQVLPGASAMGSLVIKPRSRGIQMVDTGSAGVGVAGVKVGAVGVQAAPVKAIGVKPNTPPPAAEKENEKAPAEAALITEERSSHLVIKNETLAALGRKYYQSTRHWVRLWLANKNEISNPDHIEVGQQLVVPPGGPLTAEELQALRMYAQQ